MKNECWSTMSTSVVTCRVSSNRVDMIGLVRNHEAYMIRPKASAAPSRWWPVRLGASSSQVNGTTMPTNPTYQSPMAVASSPCQPHGVADHLDQQPDARQQRGHGLEAALARSGALGHGNACVDCGGHACLLDCRTQRATIEA